MFSTFLRRFALAAAFWLAGPSVYAADKIVLGTDWRAESAHGGYYQALATGLYAAAGLDVTIRQGGPQINHAQLLAAGRLDINVAPNSFGPLNYVAQKIPMVAVAAIFQKDPAILISGFEPLKKLAMRLADLNDVVCISLHYSSVEMWDKLEEAITDFSRTFPALTT